MKITKIRHQCLLDAGLSEKLETLSRRTNSNKSDILSKAAIAFLEQRGETEIDRRYGKRLDKLSEDLGRANRIVGRMYSDVEMILESLALFIRFSIAMSAHTPLPDKATQAVAHERFLKFVDQVGRRLGQGKKPFADDDPKEAV